MHHFVGPVGLGDVEQSAQRHHFIVLVAGIEAADRLRPKPKRVLALDVDLVDAVQKIEVVHVGGPQVALKGIEDRAERHAQRLGFPAVDVQIELGRLRTESGERVHDRRLSDCFSDQSVGGRLQSGQAGGATVLYLQFQAACVPDSLDRRRRKYHRPAVLKRGKASLHFGQDGKTVLFRVFCSALQRAPTQEKW